MLYDCLLRNSGEFLYVTALIDVRFWDVLKSVTEDIKEKIPYVALDYEQEVETAKSSSAIKVTYELPNMISSLQGLNFLAVQIFFICLL